MPDSLFATLLHTLDSGSISSIAGSLGQSEQAVSRGMESSIATVLGGLASKSEDLAGLRKLLDLLPGNLGEISWSRMAGSLSNPNSPFVAAGHRILSGLFGTSERAVTDAVGKESGLSPSSAGTLMTMAAPLVIGFLSKRVRDEGMSMRTLGNLLHKESPTIRSGLPPSLSNLVWSHPTVEATASPVVAQSVHSEPSMLRWALPLGLFALALGGFWLLTHARRPAVEVGRVTTGTANRIANDTTDLLRQKTPAVTLHLPPNGPEERLLVLIKNPTASLDQASQIDFDGLHFASGSATVAPRGEEQITNVASILTAYPNVRLKIDGHTDSVGDTASNLALARSRAENVKAELVAKGISPDRLTTEAFGDQNPVSDNSTEDGRASNRRVDFMVTQR